MGNGNSHFWVQICHVSSIFTHFTGVGRNSASGKCGLKAINTDFLYPKLYQTVDADKKMELSIPTNSKCTCRYQKTSGVEHQETREFRIRFKILTIKSQEFVRS